jgi:hypothetical protein
VSQPTASEHLNTLISAGLIRGRMEQWRFYKRDEAAIRKMKRMVGKLCEAHSS